MVKRKATQDVNREIPIYPDTVYTPPPKAVKKPISKIYGRLSDIDPKLNADFEKILHFRRV